MLHRFLGTLQLQRQTTDRLVQRDAVRESLEATDVKAVCLQQAAVELGARTDLDDLRFAGLRWWRQLRRRLRTEPDGRRRREVVIVLGVPDERSSRILQLEGVVGIRGQGQELPSNDHGGVGRERLVDEGPVAVEHTQPAMRHRPGHGKCRLECDPTSGFRGAGQIQGRVARRSNEPAKVTKRQPGPR